MGAFWSHFRGALRRVFPDVPVYAQAVAFGGFLTFFPLMLLFLSALATSDLLSAAVEEIFSRFRAVLPPGSERLVVNYLTGQGSDPSKWWALGAGGTLLGGLQVMNGLMSGFRQIYGERQGPGFWRDQLRALLLLSLTIGPWIGAVVLTVFGRQVREWLIGRFGLPGVFNAIWGALFTALALVLAMITLSLIYHYGRMRRDDWNRVWPGTLVATVLWWIVNMAFGEYVRRMPYSAVYGGLAATIGLLVWLYLSALVVYIGAGYNAEVFSSPARAPRPKHHLSIFSWMRHRSDEQRAAGKKESHSAGS